MSYGNALQAMLSSAAKPALGSPPAAMGVGAGPPPGMPGLPPAPTGIGAMPTGDPSTTKKASADQAILALREAQGHYPELAPQLSATIDALKSAAQTPSGGAGAMGAPPSTGSAVPPPTAPMESGSSGAM